jgi:hypothetical protein
VPALGRVPCLIHDEYPTHFIAESLHDVPAQIIAYTLRIPNRHTPQALHPLRPLIPECFGELPAILPLDTVDQPNQVSASPLAHFCPRKARSDARLDLSKNL